LYSVCSQSIWTWRSRALNKYGVDGPHGVAVPHPLGRGGAHQFRIGYPQLLPDLFQCGLVRRLFFLYKAAHRRPVPLERSHLVASLQYEDVFAIAEEAGNDRDLLDPGELDRSGGPVDHAVVAVPQQAYVDLVDQRHSRQHRAGRNDRLSGRIDHGGGQRPHPLHLQ